MVSCLSGCGGSSEVFTYCVSPCKHAAAGSSHGGKAYSPLSGVRQAGMPFEVSLRVHNRTRHLQELTVRIGDTSGFVMAGELSVHWLEVGRGIAVIGALILALILTKSFL